MSPLTASAIVGAVPPRGGPASRTARRRWLVPALLLLTATLLALAAPVIAHAPPTVLGESPESYGLAPGRLHPFGTDSLGRDVLGLLLYALRVSIGIAALSVLLSTIVGTGWGIVAGWTGGVVERAMLRLLDVFLAIPRVLILLALVAFWPRVSVLGLAVLLGLTGWFDVARLVRAEVATLREQDWLAAARATGVGRVRIVVRHLLPHLTPTLGVASSLGVAGAIALEAGLSYLGFGVQAPGVSLGTLLADSGGLLALRWWMTVIPGVAIAALVLACVALGDALRGSSQDAQVAA